MSVEQESVPAVPSECDLPIFLVGCHRSGTTLLRYLLDSHPRIACPPETKFIAAIYEMLRFPQAVNGMRSLGLDMPTILLELGRFVDGLMRRYMTAQKKARWADKTPNYYRLLPFIDRLFAGRVLYVFIVRHPFDTCMSLQQVFGVTDPVGDFADPDIASAGTRRGADIICWLRYWCNVYETILAFSLQTRERCLTVRYEDLVSDPDRIASDIFGFLGETYDSAVVKQMFENEHTLGYQDPKIRKSRRIHAESVGRFRSWSTERRRFLWTYVAHVAAAFDYSWEFSDASDSTPSPQHLSHGL